MCVCDVYKLNCPAHTHTPTHRQWATHIQSEWTRVSAAVVDFMLAVKLFHLHFVCLPSYHMLGLCHYDDLWAEIIFGLHHLRLGLTMLDVLPACFLRRLWTTLESGICRPPESMQQFTNYNFNFSFCLSLSPFATNFRGIFHTWLRLLIWKAFLCHSIGTCHVPTHPSLTTHTDRWPSRAENAPFPCVEIGLRIDDRANRSPHQSTQQVRAKRVCHKNSTLQFMAS